MRRIITGIVLPILLTTVAYAQGGAEGYDKMSVQAGEMMGNFNTGRLDSLTGGAHIVLKASDGSKPDMPIKASTITFTWLEGQTTPSNIKMVGNVDIKHPSAKITAERADWNLVSGELKFTGNPVMDSAMLKGMRAKEININLNTGAYSVVQGEIDEAPLEGMDSSDAPIVGELADTDVTNWAGLIDAIKAQGDAEGENPGKQVLKQLGSQTSGLLMGTDTAVLVENKAKILGELNKVIRKPGLFSRTAWESQEIVLSDEIEALLNVSSQTAEQQVRQNRLLLQAAYPDSIAAI